MTNRSGNHCHNQPEMMTSGVSCLKRILYCTILSRIDKIIGTELAISQVSNILAGSIDGDLVSFHRGCSADETLSDTMLFMILEAQRIL